MNSKRSDSPMEKEEVTKLLNRYNNGTATPDDMVTIEQCLENGIIEIDDLNEMRGLEDRLQKFEYPSPSADLDVTFYQMLARENKQRSGFSVKNWFGSSLAMPGLAFASITFMVGLAIGYAMFRPAVNNNNELQSLTSEVNSLKEMMMLSLLEKESATERLKAVSLTQDMQSASNSVTKALLATLNSDENVNVRLASLEALIPYTKDSEIREELIKSISKQQSPLVQIALADLMVALQERSSVKEFEKLFESDRMPEEIKQRIREKIEIIV